MKSKSKNIHTAAFRLCTLCMAIVSVFSMMAEKQSRKSPEQRARAAEIAIKEISEENNLLESRRDSLQQLISGGRKSPLEDEIATLRQTLADLNAKEAALSGKMQQQGEWVKGYLPKLIAGKKSLLEESVFDMKESDLIAFADELKPFASEPQAKDVIYEINGCLEVKKRIDSLRKAIDSPLTPARLKDARTVYASLGKDLRDDECARLKEEFEAPLNDYAACGPAFLALAEGFNTYKQVKGMRGHVARNPGSASNYSEKILEFFAQYCRENDNRIKTIQSVPYFKRQWEAYAAQLRHDPFTTPGVVESEIVALGYECIPQ